jgi:hypothetical protein
MLRPWCKIYFTKYDLKTKVTGDTLVFDFVNTIEIEYSFEDLTQTAKIIIPRKLQWEGKPIAAAIDSVFKSGDKVKIETGYFPNIRTAFIGYISSISLNVPLTITCEDDMLLLKQKKVLYPNHLRFNKYGKSGRQLKHPKIVDTKISLDKLLTDVLLEGTDIKYRLLTKTDINIKRLDSSVCTVLHELKKEYGLYSYFRDGILNIGLAADASHTNTEEFFFEETIIDESNLTYQRKDDVLLKVRAESINLATNERINVEVGDDDGAHKSFFILNATKAELKKFAESKLGENKYEGFRGSFKTFGEPYMMPGDAAKLTSKRFPEKNGTYQIISVRKILNVSEGYKQDIQIGARLSF